MSWHCCITCLPTVLCVGHGYLWYTQSGSIRRNMQLKIHHHWNKNVVILIKFSALTPLEVVILTTYDEANYENVVKMTITCHWYITSQELCTKFTVCISWFCHVLVIIDIIHILQGYFTGTGAIIYDCPRASEITLKHMGKYLTAID